MNKTWLVIVIAGLALLFSASVCLAKDQYRGYWVDAFHLGYMNASQVDQLVADVQASNCNMVLVEVRVYADAYYASPHDPWRSDADPTFDSLAYLIKKCHEATPRIEVHAWMVTFRVGTSGYSSDNPGNLYPQFLTKDNTGATSTDTFDPGNPECLKYIADVYLDVLSRYDVDGTHYDYVRFYGSTWGYNTQNVARYNTYYGLSGTPVYTDEQWKQWRRDQITGLVRQIYARAMAAAPARAAKGFRPWTRITGATITWGNGPGTNDAAWTGTSAYASIFQDWRAWMEEGILDVNIPMTYYNYSYVDGNGNHYSTYYNNWIEYEKNHKYNRHLAIGPGVYLNSVPDAFTEISNGLQSSTRGNEADGFVFYSYATPSGPSGTPADPIRFRAMLTTPNADNSSVPPFPTKVGLPSMPWKESPTTANLMGCVTFQSGAQSIWGDMASVSISGPVSRSMRVDGNGFYAFIDIPAGTYTVTASKAGLGSQVKTISVSNGQIPALNFHLGGTDTTAPAISGVGVVPNVAGKVPMLTDSKAIIVWNTNEPADSQVEYGTTVSYGSASVLDPMLSWTRAGYGGVARGHVVALAGLLPATTYHYRVVSRDSSGNVARSGDYTFTTASGDTTPPVLGNIQVTGITGNSATITWTTHEPATSQVQYGTDIQYGSSTTLNSSLVTSHSVTVTGLTPNTVYHYRVKSADAASNLAVSWDLSFTSGSTDTVPPVITNIQVSDVFATAATITWTTDEPATSQVEFGQSMVYNKSTPEDATLTTSHSVLVSGLAQQTLYHFRVTSRDFAGNRAYSSDSTFTTILPSYGEIIIDNVDPGFRIDSGTWSTGTMATDRYGADYRWVALVPSTDPPTAVARWTPRIPVSGNWQVYAWWPQGTNRPTNSPYRIYYKGGSAIVRVNQQAGGGQWNLLGTYPMEAGGNNYVTMSNDADPTGKVTMADAVRFVPAVTTFTTAPGFVRQGWNLVSLPGYPQDPDPLVVFTGIDVPNSSLQYWQNNIPGGGYQIYGQVFGWTGPLAMGLPYWFDDPDGGKALSYTGLESVSDFQITIAARPSAPYWAMIGHPFYHNTLCANIQFSTVSHPTPLGWADAYNAGIVDSAAQCFRDGSFVSAGPPPFMVETDHFEPWRGYWLMVRTMEPVTITIPEAP